MDARFHVFACARPSDTEHLVRNLFASPAIADDKVPLSILWNQPSASIAFRNVMDQAKAPFLIFTHCDVYFPKLWFERLEWEVDRLSRMDANWAVAGISGKTQSDELVGRMWDASLDPIMKGIYGKELAEPVPIVSTDELALIVRKGSAASFDPRLPNFHFYGTDVILTAEKIGQRSYGLDMPLIHNAKAHLRIERDFLESYRYMARKWKERLPVPTTTGTITPSSLDLLKRRLRIRYKAIFRGSTYSTQRVEDPAAKAAELGLDQLLAVPKTILKTREQVR